jgi:tryptophan synthase alpha chain
MNRIEETLARLKAQNKKMLSPYITAGDPKPDVTIPIMHELVKAGADILEIGIPFSDPMAEGPVIQAAMERALSYGITIDDVFNMVSEFRKDDITTPIILMGYLNPVEQYGYERFANAAKKSGVDGTILVDLPPEESEQVAKAWASVDLYSIYLCSPTTTDARLEQINELGRGYLYYVSLKGVTGSNSFELEAITARYQYLKNKTNLPIMVGFGIKTPQMAADVATFADGVIVGAALIKQILHTYNSNNFVAPFGTELIQNMRTAMDKLGNEL